MNIHSQDREKRVQPLSETRDVKGRGERILLFHIGGGLIKMYSPAIGGVNLSVAQKR